MLSDELRDVAGPGGDVIAGAVSDALSWLLPDDPEVVLVDVGPPVSHGIAVNDERILIPSDRLDGLVDEDRSGVIVNLVWDLHGAVGALAAMRAGIQSVDDGVAVIEAMGSWHQYQRLVVEGGFDSTLIQLPSVFPGDLLALGKLAGWAAAGHSRASNEIELLSGREGELGRALVSALREEPPSPRRPEIACTTT